MAKKAKNESVKRVFGSLINNASAIDGAKFSPWWIGVVMFVLGLLLPIVPLFVNAAKTNGTSFMKTAEYGLGLDKTFGAAIYDLNGALTFNNTEKTIDWSPNTAYSSDDETLIGGYVATSGVTKDQYDLRVYFSNLTNEDEINKFITAKESIVYKKGTVVPVGVNEEGYTPSSIYFFKNTFFLDIYASNSTTKKTSMMVLADMNCLDLADGNLKTYLCGSSFSKDNAENRITAVNNLKTLIDDTYETAKSKQMWLGSLIYLGVYTAVNFFMMLMIFLMSRGKNNPNNYLNFWTCMKIGMWTSFCPGLLGLILGFIFPGNAMMLYVMLIAMRTMWLTMKELRPTY
ncbi:MAG: hypothetical protein MJZ37_05615 [Bacilli bacterium]|nr:hypothetical protein [Bacilli bacterium]